MTGNRIYYLAIPPSLYEPTVHMIGDAGLSSHHHSRPWIRIAVEKPFGSDLSSAQYLNHTILKYFQERQIFRIDHYLARETVQSVLMFHFANAIFEPVWNGNYIDSVSIIASETVGVEHRAGYYEDAGVIRDMFQNRMMQLLALAAMEPPSIFEAERVRDEKTKLFRALRPFAVTEEREYPVFGQYGRGFIDGNEVQAYRDEEGVENDSLTPTFAMLRVDIDNWRWQGVPFYLVSGKRMTKKITEIVIKLKEVPHSMFRNVLGNHISVTMNFNFLQNYTGPILDAYEKALHDVIEGAHMFFWRQDEVELCWSYLTPILEYCETCRERASELLPYVSGSWGPEHSDWQVKKYHERDM